MAIPYHPFTLTWSAVAVFTLVGGGLLGRDRSWLRPSEISLGIAGLCLWTFKVIWFSQPTDGRDPYVPLHLCNFAEVASYLSLITAWRWIKPLVYFWSLGALQAFISPIDRSEPNTLDYWLFWIPHVMIVGMAIYEVVVRRFRPTFRDLGIAILATLIYTGIVLPYNLVFDANYGYVGQSTPKVPTIIDHLGPWPLRVIFLALMTVGVFVLAWLPWAIASLNGTQPKNTS